VRGCIREHRMRGESPSPGFSLRAKSDLLPASGANGKQNVCATLTCRIGINKTAPCRCGSNGAHWPSGWTSDRPRHRRRRDDGPCRNGCSRPRCSRRGPMAFSMQPCHAQMPSVAAEDRGGRHRGRCRNRSARTADPVRRRGGRSPSHRPDRHCRLRIACKRRCRA